MCFFVERRMNPILIIKLEIVVQSAPSSVNRIILVTIDMFIVYWPPEPLIENIVKHSACPSTIDEYVSRRQRVNPFSIAQGKDAHLAIAKSLNICQA